MQVRAAALIFSLILHAAALAWVLRPMPHSDVSMDVAPALTGETFEIPAPSVEQMIG